MVDAHKSQMPAWAVREVVDWLHQARIRVWLDGGWGVDALLGRETRPHHDVDIIVSVSDVPKLLEVYGTNDMWFPTKTPADRKN